MTRKGLIRRKTKQPTNQPLIYSYGLINSEMKILKTFIDLAIILQLE